MKNKTFKTPKKFDIVMSANMLPHKMTMMELINSCASLQNCDRVVFSTYKPKWDWTTLFGEDQRTNFSFKPAETKSSPVSFWNFATVEECKNFVSAYETDILMFAHYISKINNANNNQVLAMIPWFGDYTKQWTETEIAKKLKLTKEEVEYIHQEMANFGWKAAPKKKN